MRAGKIQRADQAYGMARLGQSASYLQQAELSLDLVEGEHRHNTVISSAVLSAIAAADAATAFARGEVSRGTHESTVKLLKQVTGSAQAATALNRLLNVKNDAQYLAASSSAAKARSAIAQARVVLDLATSLKS